MMLPSDFPDTEGANPEGTDLTDSDTGGNADENQSGQRNQRRSPRRSQNNAVKRQLAEVTKELEALKGSLSQSGSKPEGDSTSPRPKEEDFSDIEDFHKAESKWEKDNLLAEVKNQASSDVEARIKEARAEWEKDAQKREVEARYHEDLQAIRQESDFEDIKAVLSPEDEDLPFLTIGVYKAIKRVQNSRDVLLAVGRNPKLLDRLLDAADQGEMDLGMEVKEIALKIGGSRRSTRAPAPIGSFSSGITASSGDPIQRFVEQRRRETDKHGRVQSKISLAEWEKAGMPIRP